MAGVSGANIVNDGLVFTYDMSNSKNSWKGAPTTNMYSDGDFQSGNLHAVRSTGSITSDPTGRFSGNVVRMNPNAQTYNYHGKDVTVVASTVYSLQMEIYASPDFDGTNLRMYPEQAGAGASVAYDLSNKGTWQLLKYNGKSASTTNLRMLFYNIGSFTTGYALCRNVQIEEQSFATPWVSGTRSNTQALLDWTGNGSTITADSPTYNTDGTFSFTAGTERITLTNIGGTLAFNNHFTISAWINSTDITATQNVLSMNGPYFMRIYGSKVRLNVYAGPSGSISWLFKNGTTTLLSNTWYFLSMVWDGTADTWTGYINDQQEFSVSKTGPLHGSTSAKTFYGYVGYTPQNGENGNFSGQIPVVYYYNKALTASEIQQNFEANRGRYGI